MTAENYPPLPTRTHTDLDGTKEAVTAMTFTADEMHAYYAQGWKDGHKIGAWADSSRPAPATASEISESARHLITRWLSAAMSEAVANGANSVSMPDELVEIAAWIALRPAAADVPAVEQVRISLPASVVEYLNDGINGGDPSTDDDEAFIQGLEQLLQPLYVAAPPAKAPAQEHEAARHVMDGAGDEISSAHIHLAWRGALKACGVGEADREAISQVVLSMLDAPAEAGSGQGGDDRTLLHCLRNALEHDHHQRPHANHGGWSHWIAKIDDALAAPASQAAVSQQARVLAALVDQIDKCNTVDDQGHDFKMNAAYIAAKESL